MSWEIGDKKSCKYGICTIIEVSDKDVTLQKPDGSTFQFAHLKEEKKVKTGGTRARGTHKASNTKQIKNKETNFALSEEERIELLEKEIAKAQEQVLELNKLHDNALPVEVESVEKKVETVI